MDALVTGCLFVFLCAAVGGYSWGWRRTQSRGMALGVSSVAVGVSVLVVGLVLEGVGHAFGA